MIIAPTIYTSTVGYEIYNALDAIESDDNHVLDDNMLRMERDILTKSNDTIVMAHNRAMAIETLTSGVITPDDKLNDPDALRPFVEAALVAFDQELGIDQRDAAALVEQYLYSVTKMEELTKLSHPYSEHSEEAVLIDERHKWHHAIISKLAERPDNDEGRDDLSIVVGFLKNQDPVIDSSFDDIEIGAISVKTPLRLNREQFFAFQDALIKDIFEPGSKLWNRVAFIDRYADSTESFDTLTIKIDEPGAKLNKYGKPQKTVLTIAWSGLSTDAKDDLRDGMAFWLKNVASAYQRKALLKTPAYDLLFAQRNLKSSAEAERRRRENNDIGVIDKNDFNIYKERIFGFSPRTSFQKGRYRLFKGKAA